ncbi:MAG: hypothetical protein ACPLXP_01830 [Microgenomates group bacterium]
METQTPVPIQSPPVSSKDKAFKISLIIIGPLIVIGLFLNAYLLLKKEKPPKGTLPPTSVPTPTLPTSLSTPEAIATPTSDPNASWKIFRGNTYTLKYPSGWTLYGPNKGVSGFPEEITLFSPGRYTALSITLGQQPYGFSGEEGFEPGKGNPITIQVGDTNYEVMEHRFDGRIFWDLEASRHTVPGFFDFDGTQKELPFHFLFGNDYPAQVRSSTRLDSERHYIEDLKTVRQILSTFKLLP